MKTAFTLDTWWWGDGKTGTGKEVPVWWRNFTTGKPRETWANELKPYATLRFKSTGRKVRVVFNSPSALSYFILVNT